MSYRDENEQLSTAKYVVSVQITKMTTAGVLPAMPGRVKTTVPGGTDTVVSWASEDVSLDALVVKAHSVLSLYGGDMMPVDPFAKPDER